MAPDHEIHGFRADARFVARGVAILAIFGLIAFGANWAWSERHSSWFWLIVVGVVILIVGNVALILGASTLDNSHKRIDAHDVAFSEVDDALINAQKRLKTLEDERERLLPRVGTLEGENEVLKQHIQHLEGQLAHQRDLNAEVFETQKMLVDSHQSQQQVIQRLRAAVTFLQQRNPVVFGQKHPNV